MKLDDLIKRATDVKKGSFFSVTYQSAVDMSTKWAKAGHAPVMKVTTTTSRTGVNYGNIASVKEANANRTEPKKEIVNHYREIVKDIISFNTNTGLYYLSLYPVAGHKSTSYYIIDGEKFDSLDSIRDFVRPSYFNKKGDAPAIIKIKADNVLALGN